MTDEKLIPVALPNAVPPAIMRLMLAGFWSPPVAPCWSWPDAEIREPMTMRVTNAVLDWLEKGLSPTNALRRVLGDSVVDEPVRLLGADGVPLREVLKSAAGRVLVAAGENKVDDELRT